ncbi:MAG: CRISPR-associated endoribonuclease Cas6 [Ardenticatenaceae bacterium]
MLASFVTYLRPLEVTLMDRHVGRWLNGLFFHLVCEADPELGRRMHDEMNLKPFTISSLKGNFKTINGKRCAVPDEVYRVRYTVLMDEVFQALGQVLLERYLERRPITIHGHPFELLRIGVAPHERNSWVATSSYEALYEARKSEAKITLKFSSPTGFKNNDINIMFPLAVSVFGSLQRTWNAFAPIPLSEELRDFVLQKVAVSRYDLSSRVISAGHYKLLGFVGQCTYRILDQESPIASELNMLADFALFGGVGMKKTQGMGQVRRKYEN